MQKTKFIYCFFPMLILIFAIVFFFEIDLIGTISVLMVIFITLTLTKIYPSISFILIVALTLRIFVMCLGKLVDLPDSVGDATHFEYLASQYSQGGLLEAINNFPGISTKFLAWIIAIFYSLFGRSELMAQSLSLFFGMASIFAGWLLVKRLWGIDHARKVLWLLALFPSLILYSTLVLREIYIIFFLLLAMHGIASWTKTNSLRSIVFTSASFLVVTFFHAAMILGLVFFFIVIGFYYSKKFCNSLLRMHLDKKSLIFFSVLLIFISTSLSNNVIPKTMDGKYFLPKIGQLNEILNPSKMIIRIQRFSSHKDRDAAYPEWLDINSPIDVFYKAPIRAIYFIGSPFPWDISKTKHLIGLIDGIFYMYMVYLILNNLKAIWKNKVTRIILLITIFYFFVFGFGVGNFGTSVRHRAKFVMILIALAAPYIPKILFSKKKKSY